MYDFLDLIQFSVISLNTQINSCLPGLIGITHHLYPLTYTTFTSHIQGLHLHLNVSSYEYNVYLSLPPLNPYQQTQDSSSISSVYESESVSSYVNNVSFFTYQDEDEHEYKQINQRTPVHS